MATSLYERVNSDESKALYRKIIPNITQLADFLFQRVEAMFSNPKYTHGRSLTRSWIPTEKFSAHASVHKDDADQHMISIAYGVVIEFRKDAKLLPEVCSRHLVEDRYDELYALLDYGNGPKKILPTDLNNHEICEKLFAISLAWLYLHEQAHLFQGHGMIFEEEMGVPNGGGSFVWSDASFSHGDREVTGKEALISHAFELAADYEATNLALQLLLIDDKKHLKKSSLWIFVAALTCIFHRFYGQSRKHHEGIAVGTHPDPALRMRDTYRNIISTLRHPLVVDYIPWASRVEDINVVMIHAYNTANMYMQLAHSQTPVFPEFMERFADKDKTAEVYFASVDGMWNILRPKVLSKYFGYGEGSLRPVAEDLQESSS